MVAIVEVISYLFIDIMLGYHLIVTDNAMDWLQTWVNDEYRNSVWNLLHFGYIPLIYEPFTNGLDVNFPGLWLFFFYTLLAQLVRTFIHFHLIIFFLYDMDFVDIGTKETNTVHTTEEKKLFHQINNFGISHDKRFW